MRLAQRQIRRVVADYPTIFCKLLGDEDEEKAGRVMQAMLQMDKIDIKKLGQAYEQRYIR